MVDGLLEPLVEDRLSAAEALEMLTEQDQQSQSVTVQSDRYQYTHALFSCCLSCVLMLFALMYRAHVAAD